GLRQVVRLNHDVASDDVLCLRKGTVLDDFPVSADDFARWLQRVTGVLEMALRAELLKPSHPFLHLLLVSFGSGICFPAAKYICKFAHCLSPFSSSSPQCGLPSPASRYRCRLKRLRAHPFAVWS